MSNLLELGKHQFDIQKSMEILWDYLGYQHKSLGCAQVGIVMGSGFIDEVATKASKFYDQQRVKLLICSGGNSGSTLNWVKTEAEVLKSKLQSLGVSKNDLMLEPNASNMGENVTYSKELLLGAGIKSEDVMLFTHHLGARRALYTAIQQWRGPRFRVVPADMNLFEQDIERVLKIEVGEIERLISYPLNDPPFTIPIVLRPEILIAYRKIKNSGVAGWRKPELSSNEYSFIHQG